MTITKKLLMAVCIATGFAANGLYAFNMAGFDYSSLRPFINRAQQAVEAVTASLNATKASCTDLKAFAKNLYNQQKNALKIIKAELKQAYKSAKLRGKASWFADKQLYKAFKNLVYKHWKKTRLFPNF